MRLAGYCLAGLVFDWVLYHTWAVIPLFVDHDLRGDPEQLSRVQACSSIVYITMSIVIGRIADRVSRPWLVRAGCLLMIGACLLIPRAPTVGWLMLIVPLAGLSGAFFWPAVQAAIASEAGPARLERDIGWFNITWSAGKSIGFLTGATLKAEAGTGAALLAAACGAAAITLFYPLADRPGRGHRIEDHADPRVRATFMRMSWIMNFVAHGLGAAIANQYIKLCRDRSISLGRGDDPVGFYFGLFLFAVFASQTLTFVAMRFVTGWTYKRWPLYAAQLSTAAGTLAMAFATDARAALLVTPLIGVGLGFGYAASIYYSLHTPAGHGTFSGLHEAILGSGNLVLPLAAGALAARLGDLRWPYWLCAGATLAAIAAEEAVYRRSGAIALKRSTTQSAPSSSPGL